MRRNNRYLYIVFLVLLQSISLWAQSKHVSKPQIKDLGFGISEYTCYYPNAQIQALYYFDSSYNRIGIWKFYTVDGLLEQEIKHGTQGFYRKYRGGIKIIDAEMLNGKLNGKANIEYGDTSSLVLISANFSDGARDTNWQVTAGAADTLEMQFALGKPTGSWHMYNKKTLLKIDANKTVPLCEIYDHEGTLILSGLLDKRMRAAGDWQVIIKGKKKPKYFPAAEALDTSLQWASYSQLLEKIEKAMSQIPNIFVNGQ